MKKQLIEAEQVTFSGGMMEVLKTHADKVKEYEAEKIKLQNSCITYEEYEQKIRELTNRLGL